MPLTRSFANLTAITTVKIGTAACRIAVRLESILVSAHAKSMNGVAVLISPTSRIATHALRACFRPRPARRDQCDRNEHDAAEQNTEPDERRRVELTVGNPDEHERRPPDQGERDDHGGVAAAHAQVVTAGGTPT